MLFPLEKSIQVNATLAVLLSELAQERETVLSLLNQLKLSELTDEQKGDILAELVSSITHLNVHTEDLPHLIGDEILTLPDPEME